MNAEDYQLAERVIAASSREKPADGVLRQALKAQRGLPPETATTVTRAVFAFYRWRGWLDTREPVAGQIARALERARRFATDPESFTDADLVSRAVPAWLGEEMEISPEWVKALQAEPRLWLRARLGSGAGLARKLGGARVFGPGRLEDALEYRGREDLFRTPEFHAGEFEVQDLSSQAVGLICDPQPGETWWDACAGEGGKTLHLSALMRNKGLIWASDRSAWRLQKLKRRAARAGVFNYRAAGWDGGPQLPTRTKFDGVLLDAPCSGTGTWHRNPHARWTTTMQDVKELATLQGQLLAHAKAGVKPGGKLVYAACTLTRSETARVAAAFEEASPDFERLMIADPLEAGGGARRQLSYRPERSGGNGMFVAAWVRRA